MKGSGEVGRTYFGVVGKPIPTFLKAIH